MHLPYDGASAAMDLESNVGGEPEQPLCQGEVGAGCEQVRIRRGIGNAEAPLSGEIREQELIGCCRRQTKAPRARGQNIRSIEPMFVPGPLGFDRDSSAQSTGIYGRPVACAQVLERADCHPSLAGGR